MGRRKIYYKPGDKVGMLTIKGVNERLSQINRCTIYDCVCDCGTETVAHQHLLRNGDKKSCGCLRQNVARNMQRLKRGFVPFVMNDGCLYNPSNDSVYNAGWDLRTQHDYEIEGKDVVHKMGLGVSMQLPEFTYGVLKGRSGISLKGLPIIAERHDGGYDNAVVRLHIETGTIDCNYRGEIGLTFSVGPYWPDKAKAMAFATDQMVYGDKPFDQNVYKRLFIPEGMRIAQLIVQPYVAITLEHTSELEASDRDARGFGSSGIR